MVSGRIKIKKRITEQLETPLFMKRRLQGDLTAWHYVIITEVGWLHMHVCTLCVFVCVLVYNHSSAINQVTVIRLPHVMWEIVLLINALAGPSLDPMEGKDFEDSDMEVIASEETLRAGQPFNITCIVPSGLDFQQQWLHPKKQARCSHFPLCFPILIKFSLLYSLSHLSTSSCSVSFYPVSFPSQQCWALNKKIMVLDPKLAVASGI